MNQISLFKNKKQLVFGGSLLKGNAKTKRPLASKLPVHLVLRSVKGGMRRPKVYRQVNQLVTNTCKKHGMKLYEYANVGNHLHLLIKIPHRQRWSAFIRELTGRIAQRAQSLGPNEKGACFWKHRPFTRIVRNWKQAYRDVKTYVHLNWLEGEGFIDRVSLPDVASLRAFMADG